MDLQLLANSPSYLLSTALIAVIALLILIIYFRIHAFISLILVSAITALATGIPIEKLVPTLTQNFGGTLASVALLVGQGAMIGKILEASGGASVLANTLINRFGQDRAPMALGVASMLFGFPIFFDAGLVVLMPIILSVAHRFGGSLLLYALPAAGGFAVIHAFVPPHPGPVAAAQFLGADIGMLLVVGFVIAIPTWYLGSYLFSIYSGKRLVIPTENNLFSSVQETKGPKPKFLTVLSVLLLPMLLISFNTGLSTLTAMGLVESTNILVQSLIILGQTPIALLITVMFCLIVFSRQFDKSSLQSLCEKSLAPICSVVLVTGAGGMFGGVLRASGIGDALAGALSDMGMPIILAAFTISACLRVAQGSATVALTTTAALISPAVAMSADLHGLDLCLIVIAIAGGATILSHFNDSGFWLVSRLFNMDEKTTLKTWTVMVTLLGTTAFLIAALLSILF